MPNQVRGMTPEAIRALFKRSFDAQADQLTLKLSNYNDEVSAMKKAMDASLEALNKDVGSSIDKAVSEAKRANDAIVALNAFDKAVASQISGMLDQSQAAIAEANALLAQMPEFEKKAQDAIDKAEDVSKSLTNYKESQQKLLNELNKKADNLQGELAAQDSKMAQAQADWSKDFEALKKSVNQSVDGITKGLSKAVEDQLKVSPSLKALTDQLDSTNDSLSKLNDDYKSVGKKVSDISSKVEPLSKQAKQAADDAQKAVEALRNPKEIGTSILTVDQISGKPHWTKDAELSSEKTPDGDSVYYVEPTTTISHDIEASRVVVDPRVPYKIEFWARADPPGNQLSSTYFGNGFAGPFDKVEGNIPQKEQYLPYMLGLPTKWTKYEAVVRFKPDVESVLMKDFSWNNAYRGGKTKQYVGGFKFFPLIPDQAEIDRLQNNAILKNTKIGTSNTNAIDAINEGMKAQATLNKKQQEWNAVQKIVNDNQQAWNKTQETVNANQSKWNQAVTDYQKLNDRLWGKQGEINKLNQAIDANQTELLAVNTRAIQSLTNGANVIPYRTPTSTEVANGYNEWTRPCWAKSSFTRQQDDSVYKGFGYYTLDKTEYCPAVFFTIDPSIEYDFEVWLRGTEGGIVYVEARDVQGSLVKVQGGVYGDNKPDEVTTRSGGYLVERKVTHPKWTKYKTRLKFQGDATQIKIHRIYANHPKGVQPATLDIGEDMRLYPHIPSQDDVNKALMDADKALKDQIDANTKIDRAQTKADEGFYKAIKALSMPEEANSLLAYIEPSDAEIKAAYESGKSSSIVYDQPEWTLFGYDTPGRLSTGLSDKNLAGQWNVASPNSNQSTKTYPSGDATPMPVLKGITYKLSFMGYSSNDGSKIYLRFYNQNREAPFSSSVGYIDGVKDPGLDKKENSIFVSSFITLKGGYHKYEFRIDFTPDTDTVRLDAIGWHFSNTTGIQRIVGMRFVPDIPSQAEIDKAQNNAIINNSNAIAINNWSDKIQAMVNDNQQKQIDYLQEFQQAAVQSQDMTATRYLRIQLKERWSIESPDFDKYFYVYKDDDFWSGKDINLYVQGKHNGLLDVHYRYEVALGPISLVPMTSQTESYAIEDGLVKYRSGNSYAYYTNVRMNFASIRTMYDVLLVYHPRELPNGKTPNFPSPPNLKINFPPKPTLRELE